MNQKERFKIFLVGAAIGVALMLFYTQRRMAKEQDKPERDQVAEIVLLYQSLAEPWREGAASAVKVYPPAEDGTYKRHVFLENKQTGESLLGFETVSSEGELLDWHLVWGDRFLLRIPEDEESEDILSAVRSLVGPSTFELTSNGDYLIKVEGKTGIETVPITIDLINTKMNQPIADYKRIGAKSTLQ